MKKISSFLQLISDWLFVDKEQFLIFLPKDKWVLNFLVGISLPNLSKFKSYIYQYSCWLVHCYFSFLKQ